MTKIAGKGNAWFRDLDQQKEDDGRSHEIVVVKEGGNKGVNKSGRLKFRSYMNCIWKEVMEALSKQ